jgi:hypothetical protein
MTLHLSFQNSYVKTFDLLEWRIFQSYLRYFHPTGRAAGVG